MEIPPSIIEKVKSTPSNEIVFLTDEDVLRMDRPPSIAEWLISDCGSVRHDDKKWLFQPYLFEEGKVYLAPQQVSYARMIDSAQKAVWSCENSKIFAEQKRLAKEHPLAKAARVARMERESVIRESFVLGSVAALTRPPCIAVDGGTRAWP